MSSDVDPNDTTSDLVNDLCARAAAQYVATTSTVAALLARAEKAEAELAELRTHELAVARAVGIVYEADGHNDAAGPRDQVLTELCAMAMKRSEAAEFAFCRHERDEAKAELARLRALLASGQVVDLARVTDVELSNVPSGIWSGGYGASVRRELIEKAGVKA